MKTSVAAIVTLAVLAGPAYAQMNKGNPPTVNPNDQIENAQAERNRARVEKEYNETMKRLRSQEPAPKPDPWGNVRPASGADTKR